MPLADTHHASIPSPSLVEAVVRDLRANFEARRTRSLEWRRKQLSGLRRLLVEREDDLIAALREDLRKPSIEAYVSELAFIRSQAQLLHKKLAAWTRPEPVSTPMILQPAKSVIVREPLGVVLVISPWNFPLNLSLVPVAGALAAGNCVVLKPSELSAHTSAALARLLPEYLDPECVRVVEGGADVATALLSQRFDHIFFTGSGPVGRLVMEAAAKHLTPVTLELGGKNPCIVDRDANLALAARRIALGKFYNAGQFCAAIDYVLCHADVHEALLEHMASAVKAFYGEDPKASPDFARVINAHHHRRLMRLLEGTTAVVGGVGDEKDLYVAPTILREVAPDSPVMSEEIFGPILPVVKVANVGEAVAFVNGRARPLAAYVFSENREVQREVIDQTSSGGMTVNDGFFHATTPELPFGGVGASGTGAYHGRASVEVFSHRKSVLFRSTAMESGLGHPPYTKTKVDWLRRLI